MTQGRLSEIFAPEAQQGIRVFSGGRDVVDMATDLSQDEIDSIYYCFDTNMKKIENVSPKLAASFRPQREAMVKFARIAKGTFPELKNFSYPGQTGGLACDFLSPYLYGYGDANSVAAGSGGCRDYLDTADTADTAVLMGDWNLLFVAGQVAFLAGNVAGATLEYYTACNVTGAHAYIVIFQDGIVELGTTPKIQEIFFKTELMNKYTPISAPPFIDQSLEIGRGIYQYTTPGMIPIDHNTGVQIAVSPTKAGTSKIALFGMCFYESGYNLSTMIAH